MSADRCVFKCVGVVIKWRLVWSVTLPLPLDSWHRPQLSESKSRRARKWMRGHKLWGHMQKSVSFVYLIRIQLIQMYIL